MTRDVCMIFGGATGIGAAAAKLFTQEGMRVVVCDINEQRGKQVAEEVAGVFLAAPLAISKASKRPSVAVKTK